MRRMPAIAVLVAVLVAAGATSGCLNIINEYRNQASGPGDFAEHYIKPSPYTKVLIEIDYVDGAGPNQHAVDVLKNTITDVLQKPVSDVVRSPEVPGKGSDHKYTLDEIVALEDAHRNHVREGDTMVLYILYLDGGFEGDNNDNRVLGAAYRGSSMVMFKGNIRAVTASDGGLFPTFSAEERYVERAVIVHELGHLLGLVNTGIPMQTPHEDPENKGHSKYEDSVMYWAVESSRIATVFDRGSSIPYQFDQYDKEDIRAVREGRT